MSLGRTVIFHQENDNDTSSQGLRVRLLDIDGNSEWRDGMYGTIVRRDWNRYYHTLIQIDGHGAVWFCAAQYEYLDELQEKARYRHE